MMRCGEREFHNTFLKLFLVFYVGNFWWWCLQPFYFSPSQYTFMYLMTLSPVCLPISPISAYLYLHCHHPALLFLTVSAYISIVYDTVSRPALLFLTVSAYIYIYIYFITLSSACLAVFHHLSIHLFIVCTVSSLPCCFSSSQYTCMYFVTLSPT